MTAKRPNYFNLHLDPGFREKIEAEVNGRPGQNMTGWINEACAEKLESEEIHSCKECALYKRKAKTKR